MSRRKLWNNAWTVVLIFCLVCQFVLARPSVDTDQDATETIKNQLSNITKPTESAIRSTTPAHNNAASTTASPTSAPRDVKNATPVIGESMKMVANQLLQPTKSPVDEPVIEDTRTPPKIKHQVSKNKTKSKPEKIEKTEESIENSHAGIAVPVTIEELEKGAYYNDMPKETSTSNEGISTWILLSNPSSTTKPTKQSVKLEAETNSEISTKKPKPNNGKNKPKKPNNGAKVTTVKRPIIASTNKSDLVAGGSAMNENMFNKIKATVLANVQKNKNAAVNRTTTTTTTVAPITLTTTTTTTTLAPTTKTEVTSAKASSIAAVIEPVTEKAKLKKKKKKNKNKTKIQSVVDKESALLPMEAKEQEIELEISTPPTTTKKPKRSSNKRKKNKTKKRKPSTKDEETEVSETNISNSTKLAKPTKTNPISTQIYNYLSREVMPTVGVGIVGLAGLVGLASYFLYPFASPVRRVFEVDKKDDLYRHNAEEYANDGNGQAEEEMLGTVLAGMPAKTTRVNPVNPYANQTPVRQQTKKESEQNIRYRHVSSHSDMNNYNTHYSQPKTGIAHGAVYSDPINYNTRYESKNVYPSERHTVYPIESQNVYNSYSPVQSNSYSPVEPVYSVPQSGPSGPTSYGSDTSNTVVYGVKPTQESSFEPVYPFEGQVFSETTSYPMTYPPTSMYLGSNNESENQKESSYNPSSENKDSKFVVGNVPEELIQPVTPAVVPEHGPRNLKRKRRSVKKRGLADSLEEILKKAKEGNKDIFISNEIDEALGIRSVDNIPSSTQEVAMHVEPISIVTLKPDVSTANAESVNVKTTNVDGKEEKATPLYPVYTVYPLPKDGKSTVVEQTTAENIENSATESSKSTAYPHSEDGIVESISTIPLNTNGKDEISSTTEAYSANDLDFTTKTFRVYEVFSSKSSPITNNDNVSKEITTTPQIAEFESTTSYPMKYDLTTSTSTAAPPSEATISVTTRPKTERPTKYTPPPYFTSSTSGLEYPKNSILSFIKNMFEFKFRLGMSILQATSDSLARYLKSMEGTVKKVASASQTQEHKN